MSRKFKTMDGKPSGCSRFLWFYRSCCDLPNHSIFPMPEHIDEWAASGRKNIFGNTVQVVEMQS